MTVVGQLRRPPIRLLAPRPLIGPVAGVEWSVTLAYYSEEEPLALWDTALWDDAAAVWAGPAPPVDVSCDVVTINVAHGRDGPLSRFRPASATLVVNDPEGELSPWRSAAQPDQYAAIRPGITMTIAAQWDATTWPLFVGDVTAITDTFPNVDGHQVTFVAVDALQYLAAYDGLEQSPVGNGELGGARIHRILDMIGWNGPRDLDVGVVELQSTTLAQNAANEAGLVTDTELGALFVDRDGTVRFVDRNGLTLDPHYTDVQYTFGEEEPELCYTDVQLVTDNELVRNTISIANAGGNSHEAVDYTSRALYGWRTYQRHDLIHKNESESTVIADRYLAFFADASRRVEELVFSPVVHPATTEAALAIGVLWRIQLRRRAEGFQVVADLQVQGINHQISASEWTVTLRTFSAAAVFAGGRWDLAKWDSGLWAY